MTARTPVVLYALDREDFLAAVTGHSGGRGRGDGHERDRRGRLDGLSVDCVVMAADRRDRAHRGRARPLSCRCREALTRPDIWRSSLRMRSFSASTAVSAGRARPTRVDPLVLLTRDRLDVRAVAEKVDLAADGRTAWFDEQLENEWYGACRGTGVLQRRDGEWRIEQYNLSIPLPNELPGRSSARNRETG